MDRISGLPIIILHDILSRLPHRDAARTSVLSKAWRDTWNTFPIFSICDIEIIGRTPHLHVDFLTKRVIFIEYVNKTLLRKRDLFRDQGLPLKEFRLSMSHFKMSWDTDLWMMLAVESGVEVLELSLPSGDAEFWDDWDPWYTLPSGVLEAKSLVKLVLCGGIRVEQAFLNPSIKFCSLRVLSLSSVLVGDVGVIEYLISHCPMIEQITLKHCCYVYNTQWIKSSQLFRISMLKSLSLKGLEKLKGVEVLGIPELSIDAPNLEKLWYCHTLKQAGNRIEILVEEGQEPPSHKQFKNVSRCSNTMDPDYAKVFNLREFMPTLKPQNVSTALSLLIQSFKVEPSLNVLQVLSPLPNIKHLHLRAVPLNEAMYLPIVNSLLSTCCPEIISLSLDPFNCSKAFIKFLYETLMGRRQDECYSYGDTKCWWHGLKNVKVSISAKMDENDDFETLLDALPTYDIQENISFRLEV